MSLPRRSMSSRRAANFELSFIGTPPSRLGVVTRSIVAATPTPTWLWHDPRVVDRSRIAALSAFADLPAEELDELAAAMTEVEVDAGARVVTVDDYGTAIYFIEDGVADVQGDSAETALGPGDEFGEIGLLLTGQRTAKVVERT